MYKKLDGFSTTLKKLTINKLMLIALTGCGVWTQIIRHVNCVAFIGITQNSVCFLASQNN